MKMKSGFFVQHLTFLDKLRKYRLLKYTALLYQHVPCTRSFAPNKRLTTPCTQQAAWAVSTAHWAVQWVHFLVVTYTKLIAVRYTYVLTFREDLRRVKKINLQYWFCRNYSYTLFCTGHILNVLTLITILTSGKLLKYHISNVVSCVFQSRVYFWQHVRGS